MDESTPSMNEFLTAFGISNDPPPADPPPADPDPNPGTDPDPTPNPGTDPDPDPNADSASPAKPAEGDDPNKSPSPNSNPAAPVNPPAPVDKSSQAFAAMRIENKTLTKTLADVGKILGIQNTADPNALLNALNEKIIAAQAKEQGIPAEILQKLSKLENDNQQIVRQRIEQHALQGFQKVKDTYGVDDTALQAFAQQLRTDGFDPFETPLDLLAEYRVRNFDAILAAERDKAVKEEQARATKAASQSSNPDKNSGAGVKPPEALNTVKDLDDYFNKVTI